MPNGKYISDKYKGSKIGHPDKRFHKYQKLFKDTDAFCAYCIENDVTGMIYVGITRGTIFKRVQGHFNYLVNGNHPNKRFQEDYNKYGETSFKVIRLSKAFDLEQLNDLEILYTNHFKSNNSDFGYNVALPGIIVRHSPETLVKMSKISKAWAKEHPENVKYVIEGAKLKREESKVKQKKWHSKNPNPASKGVICYDYISGKQHYFWCIKAAAEALGISKDSIQRRLIVNSRSTKNPVTEKMPYFFKLIA